MEDKKFDEVMGELRSMQEQLKNDRDAFAAEQRAFEQEKASIIETASQKRENLVGAQVRDIISAMKEKRAITLNGTGAVEVVNELFKVFKK